MNKIQNMDLYQLRAFFAAGRTLSYTEAAKKLYVTQSAVSHAVAKLSRGLGEPLFRKAGGRLELTEAGRILYASCEKVFYELESAGERIAALKSKGPGSIRLGATVEFGTTLLIKYLRDFLGDNPGVHVDFQFRHDLLKPLLNDELDIAIDCRDHRAEGLQNCRQHKRGYWQSPSILPLPAGAFF